MGVIHALLYIFFIVKTYTLHGGLAQSEERLVRNQQAPRSKLGFSSGFIQTHRAHTVRGFWKAAYSNNNSLMV